MQLVMSRRPMFLLLNVSSDTLHEKDGGIYSGGDLITWASEILAREGAVAPVQIAGRLCRLSPAGMVGMSGKVTPAASDHPGIFRFSIETGMANQWELVLTAAVPGETRPCHRQGDLQRQVSDPERRQRWPRGAHRRSTRKINSTS
jgi:hypothetical protein